MLEKAANAVVSECWIFYHVFCCLKHGCVFIYPANYSSRRKSFYFNFLLLIKLWHDSRNQNVVISTCSHWKIRKIASLWCPKHPLFSKLIWTLLHIFVNKNIQILPNQKPQYNTASSLLDPISFSTLMGCDQRYGP